MKKLDSFSNPSPSQENRLAERLKNNAEVQHYLKENNLDESLLQEKGVSVSNWLKQKEHCEKCIGLQMCNRQTKGYTIALDQMLNEYLTPCRYLSDRQKQLSHRSNYLLCDLTERSLKNDINNIDLSGESRQYREIVSWIKQWIDEMPSRGFYFYGGLGVGKTYLASCITNAMAKKGFKVAFVNMPRLASDLRNNLREEDYVDSRLRRMRKADVLVLDDIGAENITEWIRDDILFTVLDYRMENRKRTIFTSNSNLESLKRRMMVANANEDETKALRIIERIRALSDMVGISGNSRRQL